MPQRTKIEWADYTTNPFRARLAGTEKKGWYCAHVSEGCRNCYAETLNQRFGTGVDFQAQNLRKVEPFLDEKELQAMIRLGRRAEKLTRELGHRPRVFPFDMTDAFGSWVPDEWLDRWFAACALCPGLDFLMLTKRPERMREYVQGVYGNFGRLNKAARALTGLDGLAVLPTQAHGMVPEVWPLRNVWKGTSVEDQPTADKRITEILQTPAAVRWISYEPALGPVDFRQWTLAEHGRRHIGAPAGIHWIVCGGESGPGARPFDVQWTRDAIAQCKAAGVPCFLKQLGGEPFGQIQDWPKETRFVRAFGCPAGPRDWIKLRDRKGGDPSEWPEDLRVRQFPEVAA